MLGEPITALLLLPAVRLSRCCIPPSAAGGPGRGRGWLSAVGALALLPHLLGLWRIDFAPLLFPFERAAGPVALVRPHPQPAAVRRGAVRRYRGGAARGCPAGRGADPGSGRQPIGRSLCRRTSVPGWRPSPGRPSASPLPASMVLGLHLKDMWGYPMWCFIGLFLLAELRGPFTREGYRRFLAAVGVIRDRHTPRLHRTADRRRRFRAPAVSVGVPRTREWRASSRSAGTRRHPIRWPSWRATCGSPQCRVLWRRPAVGVHRRGILGQSSMYQARGIGATRRRADLARVGSAPRLGSAGFSRRSRSRRSSCPTCRL